MGRRWRPNAPKLARPLTPKCVVWLYDTGQRVPVLDGVHLHRPGRGQQWVVGHLRRRSAGKLPARLQAGRRPPDDSEDVEHIGPSSRLRQRFHRVRHSVSGQGRRVDDDHYRLRLRPVQEGAAVCRPTVSQPVPSELHGSLQSRRDADIQLG